MRQVLTMRQRWWPHAEWSRRGESDDEPWTYIGSDQGISRHPPTDVMPLVAKPLENATFLCADEHACRVLVRERGEVIDWHGQALDPELAASLNPGPSRQPLF